MREDCEPLLLGGGRRHLTPDGVPPCPWPPRRLNGGGVPSGMRRGRLGALGARDEGLDNVHMSAAAVDKMIDGISSPPHPGDGWGKGNSAC